MKKIIKIVVVALVLVATSCTNSTVKLKIEDQNGDAHYYGRSPVESIEMWCFIHNQYETIKIK